MTRRDATQTPNTRYNQRNEAALQLPPFENITQSLHHFSCTFLYPFFHTIAALQSASLTITVINSAHRRLHHMSQRFRIPVHGWLP
jgi:hypothetical protein